MSEGESLDQPKPMTEEQIKRVAVGLSQKQLSGKVVLVDYDPTWPHLFVRESERVSSALGRKCAGDRARRLHIGPRACCKTHHRHTGRGGEFSR